MEEPSTRPKSKSPAILSTVLASTRSEDATNNNKSEVVDNDVETHTAKAYHSQREVGSLGYFGGGVGHTITSKLLTTASALLASTRGVNAAEYHDNPVTEETYDRCDAHGKNEGTDWYKATAYLAVLIIVSVVSFKAGKKVTLNRTRKMIWLEAALKPEGTNETHQIPGTNRIIPDMSNLNAIGMPSLNTGGTPYARRAYQEHARDARQSRQADWRSTPPLPEDVFTEAASQSSQI
jgi:hypothetical protein